MEDEKTARNFTGMASWKYQYFNLSVDEPFVKQSNHTECGETYHIQAV